VDAGSYLGDIDIGDMFHNFILHEKVQMLAGIDLTPFFPEELTKKKELKAIWLRWVRSAMGLKSSPYNSIQGILVVEEVIKGDHLDEQNIFRWDDIDLNLPGDPVYQPGLPWICKRQKSDGCIACDFVTYVDDMRSGGNGWIEARKVSRTIDMKLNYLELQDAARKRRDPSQQPGPWAGSVVGIEEGVVYVIVTQECWDKAKMMVKWMCRDVESSDEVDFKILESYRGFLVYFSRTYPACVPYLKGIHLTLDSWRPWRKEDGWKYSLRDIRTMLEGADVGEAIGCGEKPPGRVRVVPRLRDDLGALMELLEPETPPKRTVRPKQGASVVYGFGDASGSGFGTSFAGGGEVTYAHGLWDEEHKATTSNFRESANIVYALERAQRQGTLKNSEVFLFTDNGTAEAAFFKGTSKSEKLFELVLRLHKIHMHGETVLHLVHVAGRRMISQGTDERRPS